MLVSAITIWAVLAILGWLFIYFGAIVTESASVDRTEPDVETKTRIHTTSETTAIELAKAA